MGSIGAHILQLDYLPVTQCHITEVNFKHWCQSLKIAQSTSSLTDPPRATFGISYGLPELTIRNKLLYVGW